MSGQCYENLNPGAPSALEVRTVPGKGRGLFATRDLQPGETVLTEAPVLLVVADEYRNSTCAGCLRALNGCPGEQLAAKTKVRVKLSVSYISWQFCIAETATKLDFALYLARSKQSYLLAITLMSFAGDLPSSPLKLILNLFENP